MNQLGHAFRLAIFGESHGPAVGITLDGVPAGIPLSTEDFEAAHKLHQEMGCICFENPAMGIYFISDPDGYWLEIIPTRKG